MGPFRDSDDWQEPAKLQDWVPAAYARRAFWRGAVFGALVVSPVSAFVVGLLWRALEWWFA